MSQTTDTLLSVILGLGVIGGGIYAFKNLNVSAKKVVNPSGQTASNPSNAPVNNPSGSQAKQPGAGKTGSGTTPRTTQTTKTRGEGPTITAGDLLCKDQKAAAKYGATVTAQQSIMAGIITGGHGSWPLGGSAAQDVYKFAHSQCCSFFGCGSGCNVWYNCSVDYITGRLGPCKGAPMSPVLQTAHHKYAKAAGKAAAAQAAQAALQKHITAMEAQGVIASGSC